MLRSLRSVVFVVTVAVVFGLGEVHAHFVAPHPYSFTGTSRFPWLLVFIALILLTTYVAGLPDQTHDRDDAALRSAGALLAAALLVSLFALLVGSQLLPRFVVFGTIGILTPVCMFASAASRRSRRRREEHQRVLTVVSTEESALLHRDLALEPERNARIVVEMEPGEALPSLGAECPLEEAALAARANLVVLNRDAQADDAIVAQVARLHAAGVRVRTLSLFYDEWLGKLPISELERMSLMFDINEIHHQSYSQLKRLVDILVAATGFVVLILAVPVVLLLDLIDNRGPLFYRQRRVGKDGAVFTILKFRTMRPHEGPTTWTGASDARIGRVGSLLRKTHIDELPQVLNVLRKDLSVVGPRPEQPQYVEELSKSIPYYDVRHLVRPGITGWAQVKYPYGATELDALEKLQFEFYYLRHQSLALDMRIMGRTLRSVVQRSGR
jgi:exopolysaccharide biosynthesis polyprenyl glycosylphosphotransferase